MDSPKELALKDIKASYSKDTPILEVGFGDGHFLKALFHAGYTPEGVEKSSQACAAIADLIPVWDAKFFPGPWFGKIKVVCCFEVLEHQTHPIKFLKDLPGETLYLSTPNPHRWLPELTQRFLRRTIYERWDYPPNHLRRFRFLDIHNALIAAGWGPEIIQSTPVQAHTILRSLYSPKNDADYDNMRPRHPLITGTIRRALIPATWTAAMLLNKAGYKGVSWYVKARRI